MDSELDLNIDQLRDVKVALSERIREGLKADGKEIKALPAYLAPPANDLSGTALVMDTGGTNMRAALVEIDGLSEAHITKGPIKKRLPVRSDRKLTRDEFFEIQAALVSELDPPKGLALIHI